MKDASRTPLGHSNPFTQCTCSMPASLFSSPGIEAGLAGLAGSGAAAYIACTEGGRLVGKRYQCKFPLQRLLLVPGFGVVFVNRQVSSVGMFCCSLT